MSSAAMTASTQGPEFRAAGTDLSERRRSGVSRGPLIDIAPAPDTIGVHWGADGVTRIGAHLAAGRQFHLRRVRLAHEMHHLHRAPDVPHAHAVKRLAQQHEPPAELRPLLLVAGPRRQTNAAGCEESQRGLI